MVSMTYGPQQPNGPVHQRFGPINGQTGGVASTCCSRERSQDGDFQLNGPINLVIRDESSRGVTAEGFPVYCKTGTLGNVAINTQRPPDSDFEISVASALQAHGSTCVPQVGVAGYFIDLGVVHPSNPNHYLMGIECDGASYHSAKSARDRDRLREAHLTNLGWDIRRIWSTDWFLNPKGVLERLLHELDRLRAQAPAPEPQIEQPDGPSPSAEPAVAPAYLTLGEDLREQLQAFKRDVIAEQCPNTPETQRLLREDMIAALVEHAPTNREEFQDSFPDTSGLEHTHRRVGFSTPCFKSSTHRLRNEQKIGRLCNQSPS